MPRRVEPVFGRDEGVELNDVTVKLRRGKLTKPAKKILLSFGAAPTRAMWRELRKIAMRLLIWRAQENRQPTRAECIATLRALQKAAERLTQTGGGAEETIVIWMVWGLCGDADWPFLTRLERLYREAGLDGDAAFSRSEIVLDRPELIVEAARQAARDLSEQRGPNPDNTVYLVVQRLSALFKRATGREATCNRKVGRHYTQSATSPAGVFMQAFFDRLDPPPRLPPSRWSEALRRTIEARHKERRGQLFSPS